MPNHEQPETGRGIVGNADDYKIDQPIDLIEEPLPSFDHVAPMFLSSVVNVPDRSVGVFNTITRFIKLSYAFMDGSSTSLREKLLA